MASKAVDVRQATAGDRLFTRVGAFLSAHRLSPDPAHYAFAYEVIACPDGLIARRVAELTDGGVRLTARDIEQLGGAAIGGARPALPADGEMAADAATHEAMIERMLHQLDGFGDTVRIAHAEANDFGRDLARSAAQMRDVGADAGVEEISRLTAAMIERVQHAEAKLESTRRETEELRAALDEARGSARTDPLTELPNRRAFDEAFAALAPGARVAVAMCDIDHFKRINDSFGHPVGDRVIRTVARTLAEEGGCLVARYGGEEFAMLFEDVSIDEAVARIDRVRGHIGARRLRVRETGEPIGTVSFSAGITVGLAREGRAALVARADAALYGAKEQGRARTVAAA
ncbi:sensor domain-containing diguanylate cyclase [Sphingomonas sp. BK235]|uniref:GGDEF domain-containing protein n=1 Tax=Sphingomonas sp. BK235 TaxID=2512131 RepID=UPI001046DA4C|nr:sensor domain-containing diguanylate cyclase [Sphingomonas sp. BK235]TCP35619.1 diguanylate cyclase [Sphingomonas sp. BK235]